VVGLVVGSRGEVPGKGKTCDKKKIIIIIIIYFYHYHRDFIEMKMAVF
jgi:hypothetical protein